MNFPIIDSIMLEIGLMEKIWTYMAVLKNLIIVICIFLSFSCFSHARSLKNEISTAYIVDEKAIWEFDSQKDDITAKIDIDDYGQKISGFGINRNHSVCLAILNNDNGTGLSDPIVKINVGTNKVTGTIKGLPNNYRGGLAVSPNGEFAYVVEQVGFNYNDIGIIDLKSSIYIGKVKKIPYKMSVSSISFTPNSQLAIYRGNSATDGSEIISLVDVKTHTVTSTINVPADYSFFGEINGFTMSSDSRSAYVPSIYKDPSDYKRKSIIAIIDLDKSKFADRISLSSHYDDRTPFSVSISPDNTLYTLQSNQNDVAVITNIDLKSKKITDVKRIKLKSGSKPHHLRIHPNGRKLYIIDDSSSITVLDLVKNKIIKTIEEPNKIKKIYDLAF